MVEIRNNLEKEHNSSKKKLSKTRVIIFILEISFVALLLVCWFSSESIRQSKSLWILFFYSFPAGFLVAVVPHEPVFLYFSKFYAPIVVTLVAISTTVLTEALNYTTFKFVVDLKNFKRIRYSSFINNLIENFNRTPFITLWVAGFTPIPFYPFRFLVVLAHYPIYKYLLAVFLSRASRFYLLAWLGHTFKIPDYLLAILFVLLILIVVAPMITKLFTMNKQLKISAKKTPGEVSSQT